jgi:hypothetical protein
MRHFVLVLALAALASCKLRGFGAADGGAPSIVGTLASLVAFEGQIDMSMTMAMSPKASTMMTTFEMKGTKMRTESKGIATYVNITDTDAKKSWVIDNAAHTYMEIDLAKITSPSPSVPKSTAVAKNLGKSDKVAGYSCELWEVVDRTSRMELCIASGLSMMALGLSGPFSLFAKGDDAWSQVLSRGFPLRIVMSDPSGAPMMTMQATRIEKKSVPDSEFAIPAGYTKTPSPI